MATLTSKPLPSYAYAIDNVRVRISIGPIRVSFNRFNKSLIVIIMIIVFPTFYKGHIHDITTKIKKILCPSGQ